MNQALSIIDERSLDYACMAWVREKAGLSGSKGTEMLYGRYLHSFREHLRAVGLDLDRHSSLVRPKAEEWASVGRSEEGVSGATYNNRLSVLSSFYDFCIQHEFPWVTGNPLTIVKKRKVHPYRSAEALEPTRVMGQLSAINRDTLKGKRDYSILAVCLVTGRRLSEIARLEHGDISVGDSVVLTWRRVKGGDVMRDRLPWPVGRALLEYVEALNEAYSEPTAHVWVSLSCNGTAGHPLSRRALANICEEHLGVSKFHSLRHTFAHAMESAGAKVSDIQSRLGHSNIATTGRYLASLRRDENAHADELARLFGLS